MLNSLISFTKPKNLLDDLNLVANQIICQIIVLKYSKRHQQHKHSPVDRRGTAVTGSSALE